MSGLFEIASPDVLAKPYSLVILGTLLIALQYLVITYYIIKVRFGTFDGKFMKNFRDLHQEAFKSDPAKMGYPDMGCGVYGKRLEYKDWYRFNCAQRIHLNYLEGIILIMLSALIAGIQNARLVFGLQLAYMVGRALYSVGYMKGADYRIKGALIYQVSQLACIVLAFRAAFSIVA